MIDDPTEIYEEDFDDEDDDDIPDEWKDDGEIHLIKRCQRMVQVRFNKILQDLLIVTCKSSLHI